MFRFLLEHVIAGHWDYKIMSEPSVGGSQITNPRSPRAVVGCLSEATWREGSWACGAQGPPPTPTGLFLFYLLYVYTSLLFMGKIMGCHFQNLRLREWKTVQLGPIRQLMARDRNCCPGKVGYFSWELGVPGWEGLKRRKKRDERELKTSSSVLLTWAFSRTFWILGWDCWYFNQLGMFL